MSHHHFKIEILDLLLKLLSNYYSHQYSCSYCKCRCHQRRIIQINTINKQKRTSRRVSKSRHLTETLEKTVREGISELETDEQRES